MCTIVTVFKGHFRIQTHFVLTWLVSALTEGWLKETNQQFIHCTIVCGFLKITQVHREYNCHTTHTTHRIQLPYHTNTASNQLPCLHHVHSHTRHKCHITHTVHIAYNCHITHTQHTHNTTAISHMYTHKQHTNTISHTTLDIQLSY